MSNDYDLKKIEQKIYRDSQQDGLQEILIGIGMLYLAGFISGKLSIAFLPMLVIFLKPGLEALRRRFTYPRIGYVKLPQNESRPIWRGIFLVVLFLFVILAIFLTIVGEMRIFESWLEWIPAFLGIIYVGMFLGLTSKSKLARYYGYAIFSVISGFTFSILNFETYKLGIEYYFLSMAFILVITGSAFLSWFLHKIPLSPEDQNISNTDD
jgi:hypothetical protein